MSQEVLKHAKYDPSPIKEIVFILYDDEIFNVFKKEVISYLEYIQNKLCQGPFITVDIIIEVDGGIVLIERSNPPFGWAIPGGFVDYGETLENCAIREAKEETGLDIYDLEQMFTYSDPKRDPRFHTVTTVFVAKAKGRPQAGDDAQNSKVVSIDDIANLKLAFDHKDVLEDYNKFKQRIK
ncbi:MAG: NUDIX hydrolase [Candidatus Omnitrophica bacterium]|nr:NUDIX hydrolase [Candidatus Omnitrophota bacterium]